MRNAANRHLFAITMIAIAIFVLLTSAAVFGQATSSERTSNSSVSAQSSPADDSSSDQSLGDVARANQEKKEGAASSANAPKVFNNADLPKDPEGYAKPPDDEGQNQAPFSPRTEVNQEAAEERAAQQRAAAGERAAAQWRQQILAQKNTVVMLQARIDRLSAQIRFVDPNAYADYKAGMNMGVLTRPMDRLHEMESQLGVQKQRLEEMQEQARRAGMHTSAYDP